MAGNRVLGVSLLVGAAGVVLLMLLWLALTGDSPGAIVLGLVLVLILAGPLAAGGLYVLSRQKPEAQAAAVFATRQRVIDADRRFRIEMADTLRALATRDDSRGGVLREVADDLQRPTRTGPGWGDSIRLDDSQLAMLERYDDLVRERVRSLRDGVANPDRVIRDLRASLDERDDLLLRGRAPAAVPASELLRGEAPRTGAADLARLRVGDAVSRGTDDFTVDAAATYFDSGQSWQLFRLTATEAPPLWLYVAPGALEVALVDEVAALEGEGLRRDREGTAVVNVSSRAGNAQGVLVQYRRLRGQTAVAFDEQWPDGTTHAYEGDLIRPDVLEVWPADLEAGSGRS
jgi:hypothetical protein